MLYIRKKIRTFSVWLENITRNWVVFDEIYKEISQKKFNKAENILKECKYNDTHLGGQDLEYTKLNAVIQRTKIIGR